VKKTSVYLDDFHLSELRRLSEAEGRSQAQILRDAILLYVLRVSTRGNREFASAGVAEGPGGSIADIPEEEQLKGFGSDSYPETGAIIGLSLRCGMKKTSVYLDDIHVERLRRIAKRERRSQAEVLRDAILLYPERARLQGEDRNFGLAELTLADIVPGAPRPASEIPDDELLKGFGE